MWSGTVAFGLVSLPVSLYPANRTARTSLRLVDADGTPLERRYFSAQDQRPLERDEIVRGYPVGDEQFVVVEDEELEALAPEKSQEIDLSRFVDVEEIEPIYFQRSYFLAPDRGALKAYRLLAKSMEDAGRVGIATFVMRDTEYLVAIIAEDGILRAQTLRFHDEIRTPADVGLPERPAPADDEVEAIGDGIASLGADDLDRSSLRDRASRELEALVETKREAGEDVVEVHRASEAKAATDADEIDLMQVLKRSLSQGEDDVAATAGSAEADPDSDLGAMTKEELYARARALEVVGRSRMTKDELIDAVRRAG